MWKDAGKRQAWRGLIFVVGLLLTGSPYSGVTSRSIGPDFAEAATLAAPATPTAGQIKSGRPTPHARSHATQRRRSASHRSLRRAASSAWRARSTPPLASPEATRPSSDSGDLTNGATMSAPAPVTVTILAGNVGGTAAHIAADISSVLDSNNLRVMPVLDKGAVQNLRDIAASPNFDLAIVQSDALDEAKRLGFGDIAQSVAYITPLYNEEVQILARGDIATIRQLDGKKVGVDVAGSATADRASLIFGQLGIRAEMIDLDQPSALMLLQQGALDAVVFADGKPVPALAALPAQNDLHFVAVPYESALQASYYPARLLAQDYPNLVKPGSKVETIAIGTILAAYNAPEGSPRYRKLAAFTQAFFREFDAFHKPGRHPKWQEVNFAADAPGWQRFKPAQDWLDQNASAPATAAR